MINLNELNKYKANATAESIISILKDIEVNDLIVDLFLTSEDENFKKLIKSFEKCLIYSKLNPEKFKKEIYDFFKKNAETIKNELLFSELYKFTYFIYSSFSLKKIDERILNAYLSLIMEQGSYLENINYTICGVKTDGLPIEIPEPYLRFEYPIIEYMFDMKKKRVSQKYDFKVLQRYFKKYNYEIKSIDEYTKYTADQQLISNMFFHMTCLIDENCEDILPLPYYLPSLGFRKKLRVWQDTAYYEELLEKRRYMLPAEGILVKLKNSGNFREILIKERFLNNRIFMLYRLKMDNDKFISGFYDISIKQFFSIWKETDEGKIYHYQVENFILEVYCHLTSDIGYDRKKNSKLKVVNDINSVEDYYEQQPIAQFVYNNNENVSNKSKTPFKRSYDKSQYIEISKFINPFIRKLPLGWKASEQAIKIAEKYGYDLKENETFVKPFEKKVIHIKKD